MKPDGRFGAEGDDGAVELRAILRQWRAPAPPTSVEEQLRRTFRRERGRRRRPAWLAIAAGLTLLLAYRLALPVRVTERRAESSGAVTAPAPPPRAAIEPARIAAPDPGHLAPNPRRRADPRPIAPNQVIVEPGQAALLMQLSRELRGTRQAGPEVSLPRIEVTPAYAPPDPILKAQARDDVQTHQTRWEQLEGEWPFAHRSL